MNKLEQLRLIRFLDYKSQRKTVLELSRLSEDHLQAAVCSHLESKMLVYFAVPNGAKKSKTAQALFKYTGLIPGVPDIFVCEPCGPYSGLYIELKHGHNKPSIKQREFMDRLYKRGYYTCVCWTLEEVEKEVLEYLLL